MCPPSRALGIFPRSRTCTSSSTRRRRSISTAAYSAWPPTSVAVAPPPVSAQYFGQNKVQYHRFDWQVIHTDHFDVHYYGAERQTALDAALEHLFKHNADASDVLAEQAEVYALDLLGFGRSAKPAGLPYGGALWAEQLSAYVRERIGRPTVLVGNSLGGYAALAAAADLGPQAAGVVLVNAAGPFSDEQAPPSGWGAIARRTIGSALLKSPVLQRLLFENLRRPATVRRTLNQVYIDRTNVDDALVESILRPSRDPGAFGVFRTVFDIPRGQPLDELFAQLQAPLLLLWGIRDPWINAAGRRGAFQRHAPARTSEVVLEAGHCPHDEVPQLVNRAMLEWLSGLA